LGNGFYVDSLCRVCRCDAEKGTPEYVDTWPVGTGPYALQQYKVDSLIRYIANPHYWDGDVPTKHLIFSITPNVETRLAKLQTNECQIIPAPTPVQFPVIKGNKDLALHSVEALNVGYLAFNTEKKPFDNVLVRQALNYATDKQAIVKAVFLDSGSTRNHRSPPICSAIRKISQITRSARKRCSSRPGWKRAPK
jgi:ABC-type transport system substrate-binding protein